MNILITGSTGFVGRNILPQIYNNITKNISILVRNEEKAKKLFKDYKNITIINQNGIDYKAKIKKFNPTIVIHLASYLTSKRDEKTINELVDVNIKLGAHLLDALEGTNIEYFINIGTFAEYDSKGNLDSSYLYSSTKTAFREIINYYQSMLKFKWINLIPYTIYGGQDSNKKVIDLIIESISSENPIKMTKGNQILDFIHIDDICNFFIQLLRNIESINENFIEFKLGSGTGTSIRELANKIEEIYEGKCNIEWGAIPYREKDVMKAVANIENNINWKPNIKLVEGIRKSYYEDRR